MRSPQLVDGFAFFLRTDGIQGGLLKPGRLVIFDLRAQPLKRLIVEVYRIEQCGQSIVVLLEKLAHRNVIFFTFAQLCRLGVPMALKIILVVVEHPAGQTFHQLQHDLPALLGNFPGLSTFRAPGGVQLLVIGLHLPTDQSLKRGIEHVPDEARIDIVAQVSSQVDEQRLFKNVQESDLAVQLGFEGDTPFIQPLKH
ncbi:hypothetical protein D3C78_1034700 [compost metagenome]